MSAATDLMAALASANAAATRLINAKAVAERRVVELTRQVHELTEQAETDMEEN